jgi:hypothetical protein
VWRIGFVLLGVGFAGSSASWFRAGRRSSARARYLERSDGEEVPARYWRAVMAKDNLIGALFLSVAISIAGVGAEPDVRFADVLLLACAVPLVLSLAWVQRFRWAAGISEADAESAQRLRERRAQDLDIAARLAARLGTTERRVRAGFVEEAIYCPVEGAVGGDFIGSVVLADGSLAVVLGDVSGHGLDAGFDAMRLKDLLLVTLARQGSSTDALAAANAYLLGREEVLATAFIGVIGGSHLRYASAGHLPGLVVDACGHRLLPATGTILGAGADLDVGERTVELFGEDAVVIYTDGLMEAYGPQGGLAAADIAAIVRGGQFSELRDLVHQQMHLPLRDDIAAMMIRTPTVSVAPS